MRAIFILGLLMANAAIADEPKLKPEEGPGNYALCLETARSYPQQGLELAQRWDGLGGGDPAKHCIAVAMIGLEQYREGAKQLEALGLASSQLNVTVRAGLLAQAAQAWILDGNLSHAEDVQTAALKLLNQGSPASAPILVDRAVTYGLLKQYQDAVTDLDAALAIAPRNADALAYRANAYRALNRIDVALKDANAALAIDGNNINALLERGSAYRLIDRLDEARQDWEKVIALAPDTDEAHAAKEDLGRLTPEPEPAPAPEPQKKAKTAR